MHHDRPCYQLRKKADKGRIFDKTIVNSFFGFIAIDDKGNLMEGKKADSQRQKNVFPFPVPANCPINILQKKIIVFKVE